MAGKAAELSARSKDGTTTGSNQVSEAEVLSALKTMSDNNVKVATFLAGITGTAPKEKTG